MDCMKCGKKTEDDRIFCRHCLEVMEQYPVKKDVHIQLPNRPTESNVKTRKRRLITPDEQVAALRRKLAKQRMWLFLLVFLLLMAGAGLALMIIKPDILRAITPFVR